MRTDDDPFADDSFAAEYDEAALIAAVAARSSDHITIAGCRHLDLMMEFLRQGFREVGCQPDSGPHKGRRPSDVLVVPEVANDLTLLHVVAWLGCDLRPGGTLVIRDARRLPPRQRPQLLSMLVERGFLPVDSFEAWLESGGILRLRKTAASAERRVA
jgi:hypothetical protein